MCSGFGGPAQPGFHVSCRKPRRHERETAQTRRKNRGPAIWRGLSLPIKCGVQGPSRLLNHAHSLTVARMVSLPRFGSLWAFGPSAHRARASLRACRGLGLSPKPYAGAFFVSVASVRGVQETRCFPKPGFCQRSEPGTAGLFLMHSTEPFREIRRAEALRRKAGVPAPFDLETVSRMSVGEPCALRDQPCFAGAIFP